MDIDKVWEVFRFLTGIAMMLAAIGGIASYSPSLPPVSVYIYILAVFGLGILTVFHVAVERPRSLK